MYFYLENFKEYQSFISNNFGPIYDTKLLCKEVKLILPKDGLLFNCTILIIEPGYFKFYFYLTLVKWIGSSLSEIYSYLRYGDAKIFSDSILIQLTGIKERMILNIIYYMLIIIQKNVGYIDD